MSQAEGSPTNTCFTSAALTCWCSYTVCVTLIWSSTGQNKTASKQGFKDQSVKHLTPDEVS